MFFNFLRTIKSFGSKQSSLLVAFADSTDDKGDEIVNS